MSLKKNPEVIALVEAAVTKDRAAQTKATIKTIKDGVKTSVASLKEAKDKAGIAAVKAFAESLITDLTSSQAAE